MLLLLLLVLAIQRPPFAWLHRLLGALLCARPLLRFGRRKPPTENPLRRCPPKPPGVRREIIRLKALMPESGCRTIAHVFTRRFAMKQRMTVGKTFVSQVIRGQQYEIQVLRKKIKHRLPKSIPSGLIWGMDLTAKQDAQGNLHALLGIVEHHSRASVGLLTLKDKTTITVLRYLLDLIERFGKPKILRTDNEAMVTSVPFRLVLPLLGIRHQPTEKACPWQNGRVERFFGTLKEKLDRWEVTDLEELNGALNQFRLWYNHVRPHQNLSGRTPTEVWNGMDIYTRPIQREYWFEAWEGLLTGFYLRH